jgi:CcmD family protein
VAKNRLRICLVAVAIAVVGSSAWLAAAVQQPPPAQQEFVPVDQLPAAEQMPAAPLVIAAYAFVWVALLGYLWSVRRRLDNVERELADVVRRMSSPERRA